MKYKLIKIKIESRQNHQCKLTYHLLFLVSLTIFLEREAEFLCQLIRSKDTLLGEFLF